MKESEKRVDWSCSTGAIEELVNKYGLQKSSHSFEYISVLAVTGTGKIVVVDKVR